MTLSQCHPETDRFSLEATAASPAGPGRPQTTTIPFAYRPSRPAASALATPPVEIATFTISPGDPVPTSLYALAFDRHENRTTFNHIQQLKNLSWPRYYGANHLANYDPVLSELMRSAEPFLWNELEHRRGRLTAPEKLALAEAARFGLKHGLCVPIRRDENQALGVIVGFSETDRLHAGAKGAAQNLARRYGDFVLSQPGGSGRRVSAAPKLRPRQVECLRWVAAGKTSYEIAIMLSLSKKTVDEHIDNACKTFGVNGRMQAVVRALRIGLLDLDA